MIPIPYQLLIRFGLPALIAVMLLVGAYSMGRKHVREAWDLERQAQRAELEHAKGIQQERERMWSKAMTTAGVKYDERATIADQSFDASVERLRRAYETRPRVREPAGATGQCPSPSGPTAADVLGAGEALAAIVRDADRDRAALDACVRAWPG